ncbi:MAG: hypothetical protein HKM95_04250, partial [Inquilinus sp.]|nr:hypothetical protein [Inquilinus sp.]
TTNSAPVANAGADRPVGLGETIVLDGSGSTDFDGDPLGFAWTLVSAPAGSGAAIDFPSAVRPSLYVDVLGTYVVDLVTSDGILGSAADRIVLSSGNLPPRPEAGPDRTAAIGEALRFDPEGSSDADEDQLVSKWSLVARPAGSAAALSGSAGQRPKLTLDVAGTYVVQLRVSDESERVADTVTISTVNTRPVAAAGADQSIVAGAVLVLDGAGSTDVDGDLLGYRWALIALPAGSAATIDGPTSIRPRLTTDIAGTYVAQLVVDDGLEISRPDTVVLSTDNTTPVAEAGPAQSAPQYSPVILDGSASADADYDPLSYRWAVAAVEGDELDDDDDGGGVDLSDPTAVSPILTFGGGDDDDGGLDDDDGGMGFAVVQLTVNDGVADSATDTVVISTGNSRPAADAGFDQAVLPGAVVHLDGSGSSDADLDPLAYRWSLIARPAGSVAGLSDPTAAAPSFTLDAVGLYVAQLIVDDGKLASRPDTVVVSIANLPPVADAGPDASVFVGDVVTLDGTGSSDPDENDLAYLWTIVSRPAGSVAELSGAATANPTIVPDRAGSYVVELTVDDGIVASAPDSVTLSTINRAPTADAGADLQAPQGGTVTLDGSGSNDPDSDPLIYAWTLTERPPGSAATLTGAASAGPSFAADALGFYKASLTVSDGVLESAADEVLVAIGAAANAPPVLAAIGDRTVAVGGVLSIGLDAADPEGDALDFFATPLPLPAGATLDGASGAFAFRPALDQIGAVALTFGVSDGRASDTESILITVTGPAPDGIPALTGRLLDAVAAEQGQTLPVVGATVEIAGSGVTATSDAQGYFTLSSLPHGEQVVAIDGATATAAPDGAPYGGLSKTVRLVAQVGNDVGDVFFLPRIDLTTAQTYDPLGTTPVTVDNAALGTTLTVAAGSATRGGAAFAGTITVSDAVVGQAVALLPPHIQPCSAVSIQPADLLFDPPAAISLPNGDGLPVGALVDIWALDPASNTTAIVGVGQVATASRIDTLSGGVPGGGLVFAVPRPPVAMAAADHNGVNHTPSTLADGNLARAFSLPSYRSVGQDRSQIFVYNSTAAAPAPIVAAEVSFPADSGLPPLLEGRLEVGGVTVAGPFHTSTSDPAPLAAGEPIRQALQFPAGDLATGSYAYRYVATAQFACSKVGAAFTDRVLVSNESDSPFGSGWTLAGLERLNVQPDGRAVVTAGDGTAMVFSGVTALDAVGEVRAVAAPASVQAGALEGDSEMVIFLEAENRRLSADVRIDATSFRTYTTNGQLEVGTIPQGSNVNSFLVHFDPVGSNVRQVEGSITFQTDIIGVAVLDTSLANGDPIVGVPTTSYPANARGLELGDDTVRIEADRRTLAVRLSDGGGIDQLRVFTTGRLEELVASRFDQDPERWRAVGNVRDFRYVASGGNPGGFIRATDVLNDPPWFYVAPAKFERNYSAAYNGWLTYDLLQTPIDRQLFKDDDVKLIGAGLTLLYDAPYNPVELFWTHYSIQLNENAGWVIEGTNTPPTEAQMRAVLGDIQSLQIRGEYREGPDIGSLDNVVFWAPLDDADQVAFARPAADFSELRRNPDGSFTRRLKDGTEIGYDSTGLMTDRADRNGNTTGYEYDAAGRVTAVTDPLGLTTRFVYGADGKLESVFDPQGRETRFEQGAGGLFRIVDVEADARQFAYDANGRLAAEIGERGFTTTHDYGGAGQWVGSGFPDGASVSSQIGKTLGLDALGLGLGGPGNPLPYARPNQTVQLTDARGNPYSMRFNRFGSPVEITDPAGRTTLLEYNKDNLVTQVTAPSDG